jgi:D-beta-D-heptose 7-phosphate kinase/D-beta-D-heptose 1-phosphate adenosyltransferase
MLDEWSYYVKTRISPEAPVPVIAIKSHVNEIGGAGNALRHLKFLSDQKHRMVTVFGDDNYATELLALMDGAGYSVDYISDPSRKTTIKKRCYIDDELKFRLDSEDTHPISNRIESQLIDLIERQLSEFEVILLSDYSKGVLTQNLVALIKNIATTSGIPIVADPGYNRIHLYGGCTVIKPNLVEWNAYVKSVGDEKTGLDLLFNEGTKHILITQGPLGVRLVSATIDVQIPPKRPIEVVDVTGAGDSLAAALTLLVGAARNLLDSLDVLNEIGGKTVQQKRTSL